MTAAILFATLSPDLVRSETLPQADGFAALRDSIAVQLKERHYPTAIAMSRDLVSRLEDTAADPVELVSGLEILARCLRRGGRSRQPETLAVAERAVELGRSDADLTENVMATALNTLALILYQRSENEEALPLFVEATELWAKKYGPNNQRVAAGLNNQGLVLSAVGNNDEARQALIRAATIYAAIPDKPQYRVKFAQTSMSLAKLEIQLGSYDQAWLRGEEALGVLRETLGPGHRRVGSALADLAALARTTGDLERSRALYEEALPLLEKGYGPDHREVGRVLNNLGNLNADQGRLAEARGFFERALAVTRQATGSGSPQTAVRLLNLASILAEMGNLELAQANLLQAEDIFLVRLGADHLYMGYAQQELGTVLAELGQVEAGLSRLGSALAIFERQLGPHHLEVAEVLNQTGGLLIEQKRFAEAGAPLDRGLNLVREIFPRGHPLQASLLLQKGRLQRLTAEPDSALFALAEGLEIGIMILGPGHPVVAALHLELARVLADLRRDHEAFQQAMLAETIGRHHFFLAAIAFEEDMALTMAARRVGGVGLGVDLTLGLSGEADQSTTVRLLWDEVLRSRGLVGEIMALRRQAEVHNEDNSRSALADSISIAARNLAQLMVAGPGQNPAEDYAASLVAARRMWNKLDRKLARAGGPYATMAQLLESSLADGVAGLLEHGALVSYLKYQVSGDSGPQFAAFLLRAGNEEPEIIGLGPAGPIEEAVSRWRSTLQISGHNAERWSGFAAEAAEAAGRVVAQLIWQPLALQDRTGVIFIVPDGVLNFVDFKILPRPQGGFMVENHAEYRVLSSLRDLTRNQTRSEPRPQTLLAMGGAEFGNPSSKEPLSASAGRGPYRTIVFGNLPETGREAEVVSRLWRDLGAGPALCLVGNEATETAFKTLAPNCQIVHLATHGFFLAGNSFRQWGGDRGVGLLAPEVATSAVKKPINPLFLAGLAFAGANLHQVDSSRDDGILTAYEVAAMDLGGLGLAVLSACQTGAGDLYDGEGVMGLRRAFAIAGVPNLVMSLGSVRDETAREWMEQFYRSHLVGGRDFQASARAASLALLASRRQAGLSDHPAFWSPFLAVGPGY